MTERPILSRLGVRFRVPDAGRDGREASDAEAASRCAACGEVKPASAFGRDARRPDGIAAECRACRRGAN